ncbi:hypothetical protein RIB2604_03001650 [Aspergillus luchuensis]|uniref:Choline monooxygenase, chloroplastic n=1 Tax=Aspergillus kawachii TaxID=1069201 RepID=A0A146FXT4_ASPKA|nr:hypothetical protein RIB2604_03001650 [Aspergillus luchuensis]
MQSVSKLRRLQFPTRSNVRTYAHVAGLLSWYLVGPVTRFCDIGVKIEYEIAQQPIYVVRCSGERPFPGQDEIQVICVKTERPLKHHVTPTGLAFATLSDEAPSFHEYFPDLEPLLQRVNFSKLPYRHSIKYEGRFNWKTMVDGYQECLHCQYTHPSFSVYYPPTSYAVHNHQNFSQHIADPEKPDDGLFLYFFPNCTLNVYGGGMSSFRVCPTDDPNVTRMEFDYYHMESGEKFDEYFKFVRQVAMEDYELCEKAQSNLTKGIYSEGILNPEKESGVSCVASDKPLARIGPAHTLSVIHAQVTGKEHHIWKVNTILE